MDSQLTLIGAHALTAPDENIVFMLDRDDMRNTTLRVRGTDQLSYLVDTLHNVTTFCTGDCLFATVTRRTFRRDQITFPGSKPVNLKSWLKAPMICTFPIAFRACGRRFEWRVNPLGHLVLRESGCPDDTLAWFSRSRRDAWGGLVHAAYLAIKPEVVEMRDMIVLSCLLVEYKLRVMADAQGKTLLDTMVLVF